MEMSFSYMYTARLISKEPTNTEVVGNDPALTLGLPGQHYKLLHLIY